MRKALMAQAAEMQAVRRRHTVYFEMDVKVKKDDILNKLRANREAHIVEYQKAVENYWRKAQELLDERMSMFGSEPNLEAVPHMHFEISAPENFVESYDSVIGMIEASADDTIVLSRQNYLMFMDDQWEWKDHFAYLNSTYAA